MTRALLLAALAMGGCSDHFEHPPKPILFESHGMPCLYYERVPSNRYKGYGGLTCDWSKYEPITEGLTHADRWEPIVRNVADDSYTWRGNTIYWPSCGKFDGETICCPEGQKPKDQWSQGDYCEEAQ